MPDALPPDAPDDYWTRTTSPDHAHVWIVDAWDVKMSHWIMGGALWKRDPPEKIFVAPHAWSFEVRTWISNDALRLAGRRYPGRLPGITLTLDVAARTGTIESDDLESLQRTGSYAWVKPAEVPVAPQGPRPLEEIIHWLEAFPRGE